jgi:hypothetical protein
MPEPTRPIPDGPRRSCGVSRSILFFGLLGAPKPSIGHAVPRSFLFEADRRFRNFAALVGVSTKLFRWAHGALRSI